MADHTIWTIPVVSTNFGVITLTHTPVINALGVVATIAVTATTTINLAAHLINTPLTIAAITVLTTALDLDAIFHTLVCLFVANLTPRTGAIISATNTLSVHRNANTLPAFDLFTLRALRTIPITATGDQAQTVSVRANTGHTVGA